MKKKLIEKLNVKTVLPTLFFVTFAIVTYFTFNYCINQKKHIDGAEVEWWQKWVASIFYGFIGFAIGKLLTCSDNGNDGYGGDYFDCTGGAGGIM